MTCRCAVIDEIRGDEAFDYAHQHLEFVAEEHGASLYRCPDTGQEWVLDAPTGWDTEPMMGRGRLRRFPFVKPS